MTATSTASKAGRDAWQEAWELEQVAIGKTALEKAQYQIAMDDWQYKSREEGFLLMQQRAAENQQSLVNFGNNTLQVVSNGAQQIIDIVVMPFAAAADLIDMTMGVVYTETTGKAYELYGYSDIAKTAKAGGDVNQTLRAALEDHVTGGIAISATDSISAFADGRWSDGAIDAGITALGVLGLKYTPGLGAPVRGPVAPVPNKVGVTSSVSQVGISNPLPENGIFNRVMPRKYAEAFQRGEGYIGGGEVWITAADDLAGVTTRSQAQQRLSLYKDYEATVPNTSGDVLVQFKLNDFNNNSLITPIEIGNTSPFGPIQPRGYGFEQGGRTAGGAREWLIGNGTKDDIGAYDINLIYLDD